MNEAKSASEALKLNLYYVLIAAISLLALGFLPLLGSEIGLEWNIPNTSVGWVVWIGTRLIVATINVLIYYCFMEQAKVNVKDHPNYIRATELLLKSKKKEVLPRSPRKWNAQQYGKKGTSLFLTSSLATVALGQAMLTFDWIALLTYLFTIIMGLIFGVLQMKQAELYWTTEYLAYAEYYIKNKENEEVEEQVLQVSEELHDQHTGRSGSDQLIQRDDQRPVGK